MRSFENCGCKLQSEHDAHDGWRHPIGMPLITCSVVFGLAPEGWSVMVKDSWHGNQPLLAVGGAMFFFCLWLLSGVGFLVFATLFALTHPLRWFSNKMLS